MKKKILSLFLSLLFLFLVSTPCFAFMGIGDVVFDSAGALFEGTKTAASAGFGAAGKVINRSISAARGSFSNMTEAKGSGIAPPAAAHLPSDSGSSAVSGSAPGGSLGNNAARQKQQRRGVFINRIKQNRP